MYVSNGMKTFFGWSLLGFSYELKPEKLVEDQNKIFSCIKKVHLDIQPVKTF